MTNKSLLISVIIPNYNGLNFLKKNLPSVVRAAKNNRNKISEIIVVDDGSTDKSTSYIHKEFEGVKVVKHKKNRGFIASVNTGARSAKANLLALINNDVEVSDNFSAKIAKHFKDRKVFAVSLHEKGYGYAKASFDEGFITHKPGEEKKQVHETFWVSGGSGVFRRSMWMKLGGMDEKLLSPFYWDDVDIGYRALKRGWKLLWEPGALVKHKHESTTGKISKTYRERIQERNQLIFIWKNLTSPILFKKHLVGLVRRVTKHPGYLRIVIMAFAQIKSILRARKKEKKDSKVSDEAIFAKFT